jgi:hypothetical protein
LMPHCDALVQWHAAMTKGIQLITVIHGFKRLPALWTGAVTGWDVVKAKGRHRAANASKGVSNRRLTKMIRE